MGNDVQGLAQAYQFLFTAALIFLALMLVLCLIRAIIGPRVADRVVAVNMMGTMVMVIIAILTVMLEEGYLADICLIYAMLSFLAVILLTKIYTGVYRERKASEEKRQAAQKECEQAKDGQLQGISGNAKGV
ncbi:MAG: sodium:proton antiporter [Clostridiales bacterium]|nr:sodium:proton antiporter [Clostridiales bacterium]